MGLLLFCSCINLKDINSLSPPRGPGREDHRTDSGNQDDEGREPPGLTVYCCGVEVDPSYNWQQDTLAGREDCRIVLYRDSTRILSFPAGEKNEVGIDADEHFIVCGTLFTSFSGTGHTVIKKNGDEFLRLNERMRLHSILEHDGHIWTLCRKLESEGFALHKDGHSVKESSTGFADCLYMDGEDLCFSHHCTNPSNGKELWYLCKNGSDIPINPQSGYTLHAVRSLGGVLWSVQQILDNMVFFRNDTKCIVRKLYHSQIGNCEIAALDTECALWASLHYGRQKMDYVWKHFYAYEYADDSIFSIHIETPHNTQSLFYPNEGKVAYRVGKKTTYLDGKWILLGRNCTFARGNTFAMALSSAEGGPAGYSVNEVVRTIDLHGYLTGIRLYSSVLPEDAAALVR